MSSTKLFDRYDWDGVVVNDRGLAKYISLRPIVIPHSFGRHAKKQFEKMNVNIVERLVNKLMRGGTGEKLSGKVIRTHGKLQGKKSVAMRIVQDAFDIIYKNEKTNPIQVLINAIENSAPREEVTRVQFGGVFYQVAVDVSASRRLDTALRNIVLATVMQSFAKKKTMAEALAEELTLASKGDINSYAIKKRDEIERVARGAR
ncbi:MAG: 30S ribosomal protein S7 [Candidatus Micrarchaeia archaeon]